jgi:hypothetical protein
LGGVHARASALNEDDDYFNEYTDTIKYDVLKERLYWQHQTRKEIYSSYQFLDEEYDFD